MARRFTKPIDLGIAQQKRFAQIGKDIFKLHDDIAQRGWEDHKDITSGAQPSGKARIKALRKMGHLFGRGANSTQSTGTGRFRGSYQISAQTGQRVRTGRLPMLPIGQISGKLHASMTKRRKRRDKYGQTWDVYANPAIAGGAVWTLEPAGTRRMVGRGAKKEIRKRHNAYKKAFQTYTKGIR